jgi:PAS domain S-box-containing protein
MNVPRPSETERGSFIGLRRGWRRARTQLSQALPILKARAAQRTNPLEKANEDLKTAQEELQRRWQCLTEAQRLSHSGTFGWKVSNGELVWSDETCKILGFTRETNPTIDLVFDRIHPQDRERLQHLRDRAAQNGMDLDVEHRILLPDGVIRYLHVVAHAGEDHSGNREYIGIVSDITERIRAEQERQALSRDLKESNARLEEAQRVAHVGYWEWDLETGEVIWSDETYRIFGLKPQERPMDFAMVRGMVHPEDREALYSGVDVKLDAGVHPVAEFRIVTPGGEVRTVHAITSKLWSAMPGDPDNEASRKARKLFGTVQDVTELTRAEEAHHALSRDLRESKAWLEEAQRVAHLGYWVWDLETNRVIWSEETYRIFGVTPQVGSMDIAIVGEMIHPDDREFVFRTAEEAIRSGTRADCEHRLIRPDGQIRVVHSLGDLKKNSEGLTQMFGTTQDITDRKLAVQALRRSQFYLSEGERLAHMGSWACNLATRKIFHSSDENARLYGIDPNQGPLPFDLFYATILPQDERILRVKLENAIAAGTDYDVEFRIRRNDGSVRFLRGIGHHNPSQEIGEYFGITMDITDQKRAEEERARLRQVEADLAHINRINMMGELAAALAHEIKQPIAASITSANALLRWLAHDPPDLERARAAAVRIEQDNNRAADVISSLRSFYRTGTPAEHEIVDVKEIVGEMTVLLRVEADRHAVTIRPELEADTPKILANRVQLQQVFMNLMLNAIEAMKDTGGELTIRSRMNPEGRLIVSIVDTGIGLPAGRSEQIFDPFHTTKPQGTGMGLTITRSIVESYGGRVWATVNQDAGATFHFTLPGETEAHG